MFAETFTEMGCGSVLVCTGEETPASRTPAVEQANYQHCWTGPAELGHVEQHDGRLQRFERVPRIGNDEKVAGCALPGGGATGYERGRLSLPADGSRPRTPDRTLSCSASSSSNWATFWVSRCTSSWMTRPQRVTRYCMPRLL